MRKWIWVLVLGLLMLPVTARAVQVETLIEIDYLDKDITFLEGEHNLTFLASDTGTDDIKLTITYSNQTGWSIVKVESLPIEASWYFTNNTKKYYYIDQESDKIYVVKVNYSGIKAPPNPYELQISQLTKRVNVLEGLLDQLNHTYQTVKEQYTTLLDNYNDLKALKDNLEDQVATLQANLSVLRTENDLLKTQVNQLTTDKEYWQNEYKKLEGKYNELKKKWDDVFTRVALPVIIGLVAGVVIVKGYDSVKRINYPSISKFKYLKKKDLGKVKKSKYIEPKQVQDFKEGLFSSALGKSYIEGKKEPRWKEIVNTDTEKVYKFDEVELKLKRIKPEDSTIKDEAKYQHPVWRVYVDGEMYEDAIVRNEEELNSLVKHYQTEIENSLKGG